MENTEQSNLVRTGTLFALGAYAMAGTVGGCLAGRSYRWLGTPIPANFDGQSIFGSALKFSHRAAILGAAPFPIGMAAFIIAERFVGKPGPTRQFRSLKAIPAFFALLGFAAVPWALQAPVVTTITLAASGIFGGVVINVPFAKLI